MFRLNSHFFRTKLRGDRMAEEIKAPIPGKIVSIKCKVNDLVKSGQVLLILEAMKMENEIYSRSSGVVKEIRVKEGDFVQPGATLVLIGNHNS
jgi:biotin carboxyl carrier protein